MRFRLVKPRSDRQALDEPGAHDKRRDQNRVARTNINTSEDTEFRFALGNEIIQPERSTQLSL
jgi:hypothetical protein